VQTSLERALAGQSSHLFNVSAEYLLKGFSSRVLYNYMGSRISDVGANAAPDIFEQGRGMLDVVVGQRFGGLTIRLNLENLTDEDYLFTQTLTASETQRLYRTGRTISVAFGYNVF
jgi:outer membrane receptor protein involved in Fe transport